MSRRYYLENETFGYDTVHPYFPTREAAFEELKAIIDADNEAENDRLLGIVWELRNTHAFQEVWVIREIDDTCTYPLSFARRFSYVVRRTPESVVIIDGETGEILVESSF